MAAMIARNMREDMTMFNKKKVSVEAPMIGNLLKLCIGDTV